MNTLTSSRSFRNSDTAAEFIPRGSDNLFLRNVWNFNLVDEMELLMKAAERYPYIAMDTEFPGVCYPSKEETSNIFQYDILKLNVNQLKIIQLGLTLCTADGKVAEDFPTWQFNFQFNRNCDEYNEQSLNMLVTAGFDFEKHNTHGIDPYRFSELLTMSGLVLNNRIRWISFHGDYDFAYLIKLLTAQNLPDNKSDFDKILRIFFPHVFDVKFMLRDTNITMLGLNKVSEHLQIARRGTMHQSGSDSRVTAEVFFKVREQYHGGIDKSIFDGFLSG